ncbi:MAG: hypothetical protein Q4P11_05910 [Methanobrevibacter sp.]|nr:hypothetical protein [Methanobrevibacter sp.]
MLKFMINEKNFISEKIISALDDPDFSYMSDADFPIYLKDFISEDLSSLVEDLVSGAA